MEKRTNNVIDFAEKRRQRIEMQNKDLIARMKDPSDDLSRYDQEDTWYPSRGVFDKKLGRMVPAAVAKKPAQPEYYDDSNPQF
jgi:hypothetical protein